MTNDTQGLGAESQRGDGLNPSRAALSTILAEMLRSALASEKANGRMTGEPNDDESGDQECKPRNQF